MEQPCSLGLRIVYDSLLKQSTQQRITKELRKITIPSMRTVLPNHTLRSCLKHNSFRLKDALWYFSHSSDNGFVNAVDANLYFLPAARLDAFCLHGLGPAQKKTYDLLNFRSVATRESAKNDSFELNKESANESLDENSQEKKKTFYVVVCYSALGTRRLAAFENFKKLHRRCYVMSLDATSEFLDSILGRVNEELLGGLVTRKRHGLFQERATPEEIRACLIRKEYSRAYELTRKGSAAEPFTELRAYASLYMDDPSSLKSFFSSKKDESTDKLLCFHVLKSNETSRLIFLSKFHAISSKELQLLFLEECAEYFSAYSVWKRLFYLSEAAVLARELRLAYRCSFLIGTMRSEFPEEAHSIARRIYAEKSETRDYALCYKRREEFVPVKYISVDGLSALSLEVSGRGKPRVEACEAVEEQGAVVNVRREVRAELYGSDKRISSDLNTCCLRLERWDEYRFFVEGLRELRIGSVVDGCYDYRTSSVKTQNENSLLGDVNDKLHSNDRECSSGRKPEFGATLLSRCCKTRVPGYSIIAFELQDAPKNAIVYNDFAYILATKEGKTEYLMDVNAPNKQNEDRCEAFSTLYVAPLCEFYYDSVRTSIDDYEVSCSSEVSRVLALNCEAKVNGKTIFLKKKPSREVSRAIERGFKRYLALKRSGSASPSVSLETLGDNPISYKSKEPVVLLEPSSSLTKKSASATNNKDNNSTLESDPLEAKLKQKISSVDLSNEPFNAPNLEHKTETKRRPSTSSRVSTQPHSCGPFSSVYSRLYGEPFSFYAETYTRFCFRQPLFANHSMRLPAILDGDVFCCVELIDGSVRFIHIRGASDLKLKRVENSAVLLDRELKLFRKALYQFVSTANADVFICRKQKMKTNDTIELVLRGLVEPATVSISSTQFSIEERLIQITPNEETRTTLSVNFPRPGSYFMGACCVRIETNVVRTYTGPRWEVEVEEG